MFSLMLYLLTWIFYSPLYLPILPSTYISNNVSINLSYYLSIYLSISASYSVSLSDLHFHSYSYFLLLALPLTDVKKPIIVRMRGTNAAEAKKLIDVSNASHMTSFLRNTNSFLFSTSKLLILFSLNHFFQSSTVFYYMYSDVLYILFLFVETLLIYIIEWEKNEEFACRE